MGENERFFGLRREGRDAKRFMYLVPQPQCVLFRRAHTSAREPDQTIFAAETLHLTFAISLNSNSPSAISLAYLPLSVLKSKNLNLSGTMDWRNSKIPRRQP